MSQDSDNRSPPYRVYRAGSRSEREPDPPRPVAATPAARQRSGAGQKPAAGQGPAAGRQPAGRQDAGEREPPYRTYRSAPQGLLRRLRGEDDLLAGELAGGGDRGGGGGDGGRFRASGPGPGGGRFRRLLIGPLTWKRALAWVAGLIVAWVALSLVLFLISASENAGNLPAGASSQLASGGPMLTSANTVLVIGLDSRPRTGPGSKEPGSNYLEKDANTDTIMLWRIGGGVSRRLSIPRDTLVDIPGLGEAKINAAWSYGGPALALKVIKQLTGVKINHLIVVDLANFPQFIDDVGGVTVHNSSRICATIAGGPKQGGFSLNLAPGTHHLGGLQAELYARVRENPCDPAYNDITREKHQQEILNGIKSQLLTFHTFLHLPWVGWDAPKVLQTDMGGLTLLQMFLASEIAGSPPPKVLSETPSVYNGADVLLPNMGNVRADVKKLLDG
jgi:LCP family protein required for cell wall assembly